MFDLKTCGCTVTYSPPRPVYRDGRLWVSHGGTVCVCGGRPVPFEFESLAVPIRVASYTPRDHHWGTPELPPEVALESIHCSYS